MNQDDFPRSTAKSIPAADIQADVSEEQGLTTTRTFPVKQPEEDSTDFIVHVYASKLYKCRRRLQEIKESHFPFGEVLLGIATAALGAAIGALSSEIKLDSNRGILFFVALPVVGVGCLVAFFFYRYISLKNPARIAADILEELPDPNKTKKLEM